MNEISWQDPIKKKLSQQQKGRQGPSADNSSGSFASQYLRRSPAAGHQGSQDNGQEFAARYLGSGAAHGPGQPAYSPGNPDPYPSRGGRPGTPGTAHSQPFQGNGTYPHYHQNGYAQQPPPAGREEMAPSYQSGGTGQKVRWNFLDLKNKKQTGDLYKTILHYNKKNGFKTFCITSSRSGEGVSTIVANLLAYMSNQASGKKILAVDANFQAPALNHIFGLSPTAYGLVDILKRGMDITEAVYPVAANTYALTTGNLAQYRTYNIEPDDVSLFLSQCRQMFDFILLDCPPVLSSPDALSIAPAADVSFLALRSVTVQRQVAQKAISLLQNNETEIGGVILNRLQQVIPGWVYKLL